MMPQFKVQFNRINAEDIDCAEYNFPNLETREAKLKAQFELELEHANRLMEHKLEIESMEYSERLLEVKCTGWGATDKSLARRIQIAMFWHSGMTGSFNVRELTILEKMGKE